jgi:hypothetical protein
MTAIVTSRRRLRDTTAGILSDTPGGATDTPQSGENPRRGVTPTIGIGMWTGGGGRHA